MLGTSHEKRPPFALGLALERGYQFRAEKKVWGNKSWTTFKFIIVYSLTSHSFRPTMLSNKRKATGVDLQRRVRARIDSDEEVEVVDSASSSGESDSHDEKSEDGEVC